MGTFHRPERPQWESLERVAVTSDWYHVYRLPEAVYAIYEPFHQEEVISYLILGENQALLWDTGMGVGQLRPVVEELWDKPYIVVNSHTHYDHIGSNAEFAEVIAFDHPQSFKELNHDITNGWQSLFTDDLIADDAPAGFPTDALQFRRCNYLLQPLHAFDLGGRKLQWIHAPGHAENMTMLVDATHKLVFAADGYYPGLLYALEGYNINEYYDTMQMLVTNYPDYQMICSHNEPYAPMEMAAAFAEMLATVLQGTLTPIDIEGYQYYEKGGLRLLVKPQAKK